MEATFLAELCELARLELTDAERSEFAAKFEGLLSFVQRIQDVAGVSNSQPLTLIENLAPRADAVAPFDWPEGYAHRYSVPQVIDFEAAD